MTFHNGLFLFLLFVGLGVGSTILTVADEIGIASSTLGVSDLLDTGSSTSDLDVFFVHVIKVYKNGTYEKSDKTRPKVPAGFNVTNGVRSKDVVICQETGVNARLYTPKDYQAKGKKLSVLIYLHGGGFCTGSAADKDIHDFVTAIVDKANIIALSVNFRVPPEHYLPVAIDDSWEAVKWLANHAKGKGSEQYLKNYINFKRVFIAGDSSGATIAHNVAMRFGFERVRKVKLVGLILFSPYFLPETPTRSMMMNLTADMRNNITGLWSFACPTTSGFDDPRINPMIDPKLSSIGCKKVLINVAGKDPLVDNGKLYADALRSAGKNVEIFESKEKIHDHQLRRMDVEVMDRVTRFVNSRSKKLKKKKSKA